MAFYKNVAGQRITVFAVDTTVDPMVAKTGDALNITAKHQGDGGTSASLGDTNPTEANATDHAGAYYFLPTQAETNYDVILLTPVSATSGIELNPIEIHTTDLSQMGVLGTDAVTAAALATDAVDEVVDAVWDELQSGHTTPGTYGLYLDQTISTAGSSSVSVSAIAAGVWNELLTSYTISDSAGLYLRSVGINAGALVQLSPIAVDAAPSYGTVARGNTYFLNYSFDVNDLWSTTNDDRKTIALNRATIMIDSLEFKGDKTDATQLHEFPRDAATTVPVDVERATYEIAWAILDGRDVEHENESLDVEELGMNRVRVRKNLKAYSEAKLHGIPSTVAWDLLRPFLKEGATLDLTRED